MAEPEPHETIDPAFMYTDEKFNLLESDLKQLKTGLLRTQRALAELQIRVTHNESLRHSKIIAKSFPQFVSEATTAFSKIKTTEDPLAISNKFAKKRWEDLEKLGAKPITIEH